MTNDYYQNQDEADRELFERIHQQIVERKLFLDPTFSRETYIRLGYINKNKVAAIVKKYAGTDLMAYINGLRLAYALQQIQEHPEEPLKAIAADSGFASIRTFYRLFLKKYGVTPKTYRQSL